MIVTRHATFHDFLYDSYTERCRGYNSCGFNSRLESVQERLMMSLTEKEVKCKVVDLGFYVAFLQPQNSYPDLTFRSHESSIILPESAVEVICVPLCPSEQSACSISQGLSSSLVRVARVTSFIGRVAGSVSKDQLAPAPQDNLEEPDSILRGAIGLGKG